MNLNFCTLYDVEGYLAKKNLKEAGIPCIGLKTDYTDEDAGGLRTRIGAFLEMLASK